jgi:hypothetical protein
MGVILLGRSESVDMQEYLRNRLRFPLDELAKYAGMYVAWSPDGTKIIASDKDERKLDAAIRAAGYNPAEIVVSPIPAEDVVLGGGVIE